MSFSSATTSTKARRSKRPTEALQSAIPDPSMKGGFADAVATHSVIAEDVEQVTRGFGAHALNTINLLGRRSNARRLPPIIARTLAIRLGR
jgi:hypothetical protein